MSSTYTTYGTQTGNRVSPWVLGTLGALARIPSGRIRANLEKATSIIGQVDVVVAGNEGAYLDVGYSFDNGATVAGSMSLGLPIDRVGHHVATANIPAEAQTDVLLIPMVEVAAGTMAAEIWNFLASTTSAAAPAPTPPIGEFDALFLSHVGTFADVDRSSAVESDDDPVGGWQNQITGATVHGEQSSGTAQPVVDTDELLNGYRTIKMTGKRHIRFAADLLSGTAEATLIVVAKNVADPPGGNIFGSFSCIWNMGAGGASSNMDESDAIRDIALSTVRHNTVTAPDPFNEWFVYAVRSKNGEWSNWWNGVQLYTTATNTFSAGGGARALGFGAVPDDHWEGWVAAFAVKLAWLDDDQIATAIGELMTFYGLA